MDQKNNFFRRGSGRNWADPSGYGVPGKPITQDQFYTEDVFRMLVPDDGLGPTSAPIPFSPPRPGENLGSLGSEIERDPAYPNDRGMEKNTLPGDDDLCSDLEQVREIFETYRRFERLLQEAVEGLAGAKDERERAEWQEIVSERQSVLAQYKPHYERAVRCTNWA